MSPDSESTKSRLRLLQIVIKEMLVTIPGLRRHSKALADRNLVFNNLGLYLGISDWPKSNEN